MNGAKHEIFISYSRRDKDTVKAIKHKIDSLLDLYCWIDLKDIEAGEEDFDATIVEAIDSAKVFLFFLSAASQNSRWSLKELRYAKEQGKRIVPIRINDEPLLKRFKFNLSGTNIIDWRDPEQKKKLVYDLARWLGRPKPDLSNELTYLGIPSSPPRHSFAKRLAVVSTLVLAIVFAFLGLSGKLSCASSGRVSGTPSEDVRIESPIDSGSVVEELHPSVQENSSDSEPVRPEAGSPWTVVLPIGSEMTFVPCSSGLFQMGSPEGEPGRYTNETIHIVRISRSFWMGETEVTQGQWRSLMGTSLDAQAQLAYEDETPIEIAGARGTNRDFNYVDDSGELARLCGDPDDETAMYNVSWDDATNFCARLTERERAAGRLPGGYAYRLPTEAEWEYAARAGTKASLPDGSDLEIEGCRNAPNLDSQGWYAGNSSVGFSGTGLDTTHWPEKQYPGGFAHARRVRQKAPNAWGLYDVIGNVFEWCQDYYGFCDYPAGFATDPVGPERGTHRVVRGGSWICAPVDCCRLANRRGSWPNRRTIDYGFRVALAPEME